MSGLNAMFLAIGPLGAVGIVTLLAAFLGIAIVVVFKFFSVDVNEDEAAIAEMLPGANCGGCGYSGCAAYAAAIASGEDQQLTRCVVGGADTSAEIAAYLGKSAGSFIPRTAIVRCQGDCSRSAPRYSYSGSSSCAVANNLAGGPGSCSHGCMGLGDCQRACQYDAIVIKDGLAHIDPDKCVACGACVSACPRHLISVESKYSDLYLVRCQNPDPGKAVRQVCSIGCIGCRICEKNCPAQAIHMEGKLAVIDQDKCTHCGTCEAKCPSHAIVKGVKGLAS